MSTPLNSEIPQTPDEKRAVYPERMRIRSESVKTWVMAPDSADSNSFNTAVVTACTLPDQAFSRYHLICLFFIFLLSSFMYYMLTTVFTPAPFDILHFIHPSVNCMVQNTMTPILRGHMLTSLCMLVLGCCCFVLFWLAAESLILLFT